MKNDVISISRSVLVKAFIISFILLSVAFTAGIVLGKSDKAAVDRTSADSSDIQEQLSDCSFKLQEITARHLDMVEIAKKKGLLDTEGKFDPAIICTTLKEEKESPDEEDDSAQDIPDENNLKKQPEQTKTAETQKTAEPEKKEAGTPEKKETETVPEKKEPEKKIEKVSPVQPVQKESGAKCLYAIQLFSGISKEQALAAQKRYNISGTRLVEGVVKGKNWYRIRYGCFSTKSEAEKFLPGIKDDIEGAIVVAE